MSLMEYSREVMPLVRTLNKKKELIKDYKDSNEKIQLLQENIKAAQKELADFLSSDDDAKQLVAEMKEVDKEVKQAVKSASKASGYKPKELKEFFFARAKEEGVQKAVKKGVLFTELTSQIDTNA